MEKAEQFGALHSTTLISTWRAMQGFSIGQTMKAKPVTIQDIRRTLGTKAEGKTDEELEKLQQLIRGMARLAVDAFIEQSNKNALNAGVEFGKQGKKENTNEILSERNSKV